MYYRSDVDPKYCPASNSWEMQQYRDQILAYEVNSTPLERLEQLAF